MNLKTLRGLAKAERDSLNRYTVTPISIQRFNVQRCNVAAASLDQPGYASG